MPSGCGPQSIGAAAEYVRFPARLQDLRSDRRRRCGGDCSPFRCMNRVLYSIGHSSVLDGLAPQIVRTISSMPTHFHVEKLSDEFGQYTLVLKCSACGHECITEPHTLGRLCGWNAKLEDVPKRMRCSLCGSLKLTSSPTCLSFLGAIDGDAVAIKPPLANARSRFDRDAPSTIRSALWLADPDFDVATQPG